MVKQSTNGWRWVRIFGALFFGLLMLALILPSTGFIVEGPLPYPDVLVGIIHFGSFRFYADALFYIGYIIAALACVIFGALRRSKFEWVGWVLLGFLFVGMIMGS